VALYARVSTLNNQDPEMQLSELREYAGRRGAFWSLPLVSFLGVVIGSTGGANLTRLRR